MLQFVVFAVVLSLVRAVSRGYSDPLLQGAFLQQFGYQRTTEKVPTGLNVLPDRIKSGKYEDISFRMVAPDTIRKMQQYAGVAQTGVFDNATIGMMNTPRCQNPDVMDGTSKITTFFLGKKTRTKRAAEIGAVVRKWKTLAHTVAFENTTPQTSKAQEIII